MPSLTRRGLLGGALAAVAAGCRRESDPYRVDKPAVPGLRGWRAGEERWVLSSCGMCDAGCGIQVRVVEGRAVKIEGNPEHPINRGGLCARGQAGLQALYHPDRVRGPMKLVQGKLAPVTWDQAMAEVADRLARLRASGHPERLVLLDGEPRGPRHELWARFLAAYGSPNHIGCESDSFAGAALAAWHMHGAYELPAHDLERTRHVLVFGTELLESSSQTMQFLRAAGATDEHGRRRLRVVCASPRRPGCRIDEWICIEPASYGALALGIAHVLVRDGLCDQAFVREHGVGFETWIDAEGGPQPGFRDVLPDFSPERAAQHCGLPPPVVVGLARALAGSRPSLVATAGDAAAASNGLATAMAIHALNGLLGNIDRPGGVFLPRRLPLAAWPPVVLDDIARAGHARPRIDGAGTPECPFGRSRMQAVAFDARDTELLFLHRAGPAHSLPGRGVMKKGPFTVTFSSVLRGLDAAADLVLPAPSPLESWDLVEPSPAVARSLGLRQPVIAPLHDTLHTAEVILKLAAALGGSVQRALPWASYKDAVLERLRGLATKGDDGEALLTSMEEKGGFWPEREEAESVPAARSRRFRFHASGLAAGPGRPRLQTVVPRWEPPRFPMPAADFPFVLVPYRDPRYSELASDSSCWLAQLPLRPPGAVEMAPADAARLGLRTGDEVALWSDHPSGREDSEDGVPVLVNRSNRVARAVVAIAAGLRPGTIGVPLVRAEEPVLGLMTISSDPLSGLVSWQETRVRVRRLS